jgi:hypothetical protein
VSQLVTTNDIPNVLTELEQAFYDIPFENSWFQTENFVLAAQKTPARAYRALGLRIFDRIQAIKHNIVKAELSQVDYDENEYKLGLSETSEFDKRRLRLKNKEIEESRKWADKLMNDALQEISQLYAAFKQYPRYTREQFEAEEALHFQIELEQQIETANNGAKESLFNMSVNHIKLKQFLDEPGSLAKLIENLQADLVKIEDVLQIEQKKAESKAVA